MDMAIIAPVNTTGVIGMKTLTAITMGLILAGTALPSLAGTKDNENLAQCKAELKKVYGEDTRLKLKSIKRSRSGNQMRINAIPAEGDSQLVTCWVDRDGQINMMGKDGVAIIAPGADMGNQVSLND